MTSKRARHTLDSDDEDSDDEDEKLVRVLGPNVYFYCDVSKKTILRLNEKLDEATINALKNRAPNIQPKVFLYIHKRFSFIKKYYVCVCVCVVLFFC